MNGSARAQGCRWWCWAVVVAFVVMVLVRTAGAGSSEPKLAIADASATADRVVTLEIIGNFDYSNAVRLGYPVAVVVRQGLLVAWLYLDGSLTMGDPWWMIPGATPEGPASPGSAGIIAIEPNRIAAVLPPEFTDGRAANVRLAAHFSFQGTLYDVQSNEVDVSW